MNVFARLAVARAIPGSAGHQLLLEGAWPEEFRRAGRWSLDESLDSRHVWIDEAANEIATVLAGAGQHRSTTAGTFWGTADVNNLALRYYLVRVLRTVAFFDEVWSPAPGHAVTLHAQRGLDEDYADLLSAVAGARGLQLNVTWHAPDAQSPPPKARTSLWRRWAGMLLCNSTHLRPRANAEHLWLSGGKCRVGQGRRGDRRPTNSSESGRASTDTKCATSKSASDGRLSPRVILCGNPATLDPVCQELVARGYQTWWLYETFAFRAWCRWAPLGVRQIVCSDSGNIPRHVDRPDNLGPLVCRGIDIAPAVERWLRNRMEIVAGRQIAIDVSLTKIFAGIRPTHLVIDEDCTPFKRLAVRAARREQATSVVVQHGAPVVRFGFIPLAADRFYAWGAASRNQLIRWGMPAERIEVTGSPFLEQETNRLAGVPFLEQEPDRHLGVAGVERSEPPVGYSSPSSILGARRLDPSHPRVLLLATVPPRDTRPDAVEFHLTSEGYACMLRMACAAVARLPGAKLVIKLHPRTPAGRGAMDVPAGFPHLDVRVARRRPLARLLRECDCVLSCASTAGVEAALAGVPVVQLLPPGSGDIMPSEAWGSLGTARSEEELVPLLHSALCKEPWETIARARNATGIALRTLKPAAQRPAAQRIVELLHADLLPGSCAQPFAERSHAPLNADPHTFHVASASK